MKSEEKDAIISECIQDIIADLKEIKNNYSSQNVRSILRQLGKQDTGEMKNNYIN